MIGFTLQNRYRLDASLGRGGVGVVYRARDLLLERDVAVKVLEKAGGGALDTEARDRLLHEARAAAQLNHPNIISIFDAGEADGVPFIIMELVEGPSLQEHKPESIAEVLSIVGQVCTALEHAHKNGLIHRDLKPGNVLITPDGTAKLTDFGLARSVASQITVQGEIVGTVFYLPPEQAMGKVVDERTDLYALGVMLYELTAGRLPFVAADPLAVITQHLYAPVVPPSAYNHEIPAPLERIILRLLAKEPRDRYASAADLGTDLALLQMQARTPQGLEAIEPQAAGGIELLEQLARGRLVGRQTEMNQLRNYWKLVQKGRSLLVLLSGEPGVGKTRLAREMLVYAHLNGAVVLQGGCYEYEAATPYLPLAEALREWVQEQSPAALQAKVGSLAPELSRLAPEIGTKLGPLTPNPPLTPNEERLRLFDSMARFLQIQASQHGLLLFIDDMHWADQGTLSLLHFLMHSLRTVPVMLLAAYREIELDRTHPFANALVEWNRDRLATRLPLGRLSRQDVGELLASLFGLESTSAEFIEAVYRETEGNPFFVEEVVKSLIEQGQVYRVDGRWESHAIADLAIPQSIRDAIGRRLNRLSQPCLETLHIASVLGKRFDFTELAASTAQSEDELLDALDEASASQLIRSEGQDTFIFTHDKIREVLYEELNPIRRRRVHKRVGEGLEELYLASVSWATCCSQIQELSYHFVEGGELIKGLEYSLEAAEEASRLYAHDEALRYYERALECAESLNLPDQTLQIHKEIAWVYFRQGLHRPSISSFQKALELETNPRKRAELKVHIGSMYGSLSDPQGLQYLQAALQELDPQTQVNELALAKTQLGRYHHYRWEFDQAIGYLKQAQELAEPLDDVSTLTWIYSYLAGAYQQSGDLLESMLWAQRCVELGERKDYLMAVALGYEFMAEDSTGLARWRDAIEYSQRVQKIGEKIGSLERICWAGNSLTSAYFGLGDLPAALEVANQTVALVERIGEERLSVLVRATRANILDDLGEDAAAQADIDFALARAQAMNVKQAYGWAYYMLVHYAIQHHEWASLLEMVEKIEAELGHDRADLRILALLGLGRLAEAVQFAAPFREMDIGNWQPPDRGNYWRLLGRILAAKEEWEEASQAYEKSLALFEGLESRLDLGRTYLWRAELRHANGDPAGACADLHSAHQIFVRCSAKRDLQWAQDMLEQFACPH